MENGAIFLSEKVFGIVYFASVFIAAYFARQWMAKKEAEISELFRRVNGCPEKAECEKMEKDIKERIEKVEKMAGRHTHDDQGRVIQTGW